MYLYWTPSVVVAVSVVFTTKEVVVEEQTLPQVSERETLGIESILANVVQRNATWDAMAPHDPRKLALDWILHADKMELENLDEKLSQRYILALIAFSMDSEAWKFCGNHTSGSSRTKESDDDTCTVINEAGHEENSSFWLSNAFECNWHGVTCVDDKVVGLDLREYIIGLLILCVHFTL